MIGKWKALGFHEHIAFQQPFGLDNMVLTHSFAVASLPGDRDGLGPVHSPPTHITGSDDEDDPGVNRGSPDGGL
jgi:hypothetical protein